MVGDAAGGNTGAFMRVANALRDDPVPYTTAALLLGIFEACGFPGIGEFLGGVTIKLGAKGLR